MGGGRFDYASYSARTTATMTRADGTAKSYNEVFTSNEIDHKLDPKNIKYRESCDSEQNPASTPVIVCLDTTGSMGKIALDFARTQLGDTMRRIYTELPITDPHLMFMGVGDVIYDRAPLQVSQFEAQETPILDQLEKLYVEGGGGTNPYESYNLPWAMAKFFVRNVDPKTKSLSHFDAFAKRGKKGFIFTIGDELPPAPLSKEDLVKTFGDRTVFSQMKENEVITNEELIADISERWEIFHIIVEQGNFARHYLSRTVNAWFNLLGHRTLRLDDSAALDEVVLAAMMVASGKKNPEEAIASSSDRFKTSVRKALYGADEFVPINRAQVV